jgi:hypothetical protein
MLPWPRQSAGREDGRHGKERPHPAAAADAGTLRSVRRAGAPGLLLHTGASGLLEDRKTVSEIFSWGKYMKLVFHIMSWYFHGGFLKNSSCFFGIT